MDVERVFRDSAKYCYAVTRIEYMHFLEECRMDEDESKSSKPKSKKGKAKMW